MYPEHPPHCCHRYDYCECHPHGDGTHGKILGEGEQDQIYRLKDFLGAPSGEPRVFHTSSWMVVTLSTHMYDLRVLNTQDLSASRVRVMSPSKVEEIPSKVLLATSYNDRWRGGAAGRRWDKCLWNPNVPALLGHFCVPILSLAEGWKCQKPTVQGPGSLEPRRLAPSLAVSLMIWGDDLSLMIWFTLPISLLALHSAPSRPEDPGTELLGHQAMESR